MTTRTGNIDPNMVYIFLNIEIDIGTYNVKDTTNGYIEMKAVVSYWVWQP